MKVKRLQLKISALLIIMLTAACTPRNEATPLGNDLILLGPDRSFADAVMSGRVPPGWSYRGTATPQTISVRFVEGTWSAEFVASDQHFELYRAVQANVLSTPYLSWSWRGSLPRNGGHPIRIRVGVAHPGSEESKSWWSFQNMAENKIHRLIDIVWGESALRRGSVIGPRIFEDGIERATYFVRGGPEQGTTWKNDTVDLSLILAQTWPTDIPSNWEIKYIGISVRSTNDFASMNFANLKLSR